MTQNSKKGYHEHLMLSDQFFSKIIKNKHKSNYETTAAFHEYANFSI